MVALLLLLKLDDELERIISCRYSSKASPFYKIYDESVQYVLFGMVVSGWV